MSAPRFTMPPLRSAAVLCACLISATAAAAAAVPCPGADCYTPAASALNATDFCSWLAQRAAAGATALALAPGGYTLPSPANGARAHLVLPPLTDVSLEMTGVTLTAEDRYAAGVYAGGWQRSSLTGLSLRWAQPPSNTAIVTAIDAAHSTVELQVEAGHPVADFAANTVRSCNIFVAGSRLRRPLTQDVYLSAVVPAAGGRYTATVANAGQLARLQVGDLFGCRVPGGGMTLHLDAGVNCTIENVTLYGGGCFGFFETGGGGNAWRGSTITYPDAPPGGTTRPLLSTSADGMHSVGTRVGPQIAGARFEGMDDDGIAIHGSFNLVTDAQPAAGGAGGGLVWVADHAALAVGDRVALYDERFAPAPAALPPAFAAQSWPITALAHAAPGYAPPFNESRTMPSQQLPASGYTVLTLGGGAPLPPRLGFDFVLVNTDAVGDGFSIRDSVIRNHRARGLLLKGTRGRVQNVTITNSSLGGIIITPELYWEEAGYAREVAIVGNLITLTSSGAQSYGGIALGAVAPGNVLAAAPGHAGIDISNNTLVDCGYAPIWLNAAGNVTLRGNRLLTPFNAASAADLPDCCEPLPTQKIAVFAQSVRALRAADNCVQPAPGGGGALQFLANYTDTDGDFEGGVTLCAPPPAAPPPPYVVPTLPAPAANGYRNSSLWSWGGNVLLDGGQYHLFASAFANGCGLGAWGSNSMAVHAVAASPLGPFALVGRALPGYHHNVQAVRAPDGTFLIFSIGMSPEPVMAKCGAGGGGGGSAGGSAGGGLAHGFETIEAWSAPSVDGPWQPLPGGPPNGRNLFNGTNPAPVFDPSGNGTLYVVSHDSHNIVASVAPSWRGPFSAPRPLFSFLENDYVGEDPVVWWDATIANGEGGTGAWRCLYHQYNGSAPHPQFRVGGYAQSSGADIFSSWTVQPESAPAYTTEFQSFVSGSAGPTITTTFARRERPKVYLDPATGAPAVLYTGVCPQTSSNDCFTIAAPIAVP